MDTLNAGGLLIYAILAVIINCAILYYIIEAATKSKKRFKYEILRTKLLMKIAEKQGVSQDEIEKMVSEELKEEKSSWF